MTEKGFYGTGKRKTSIARVWIIPGGNGTITVNNRLLHDYFPRETSRMMIRQPLELTNRLAQYDVWATVQGGGLSGQAGAIKHGIAKALLQSDLQLRGTLKRAGLLNRDSRVKERKKYGQRGARARFQFSKR
ncbi:MAG: 30S ribosomal protein S9 [Candidatus Tectomicrobia bacterium]|nr:30S ribosomal protein S9 [Candidatus Tectomicrobia bacterium]